MCAATRRQSDDIADPCSPGLLLLHPRHGVGVVSWRHLEGRDRTRRTQDMIVRRADGAELLYRNFPTDEFFVSG